MKKYFSREYTLVDINGQSHRFSSKIEATDETIGSVLQARNIGEQKERFDPLPSDRRPHEKSLSSLIKEQGFTSTALHMACFVGFVALKSGTASPEEILGDTGLIHEIAHNMELGEGAVCIATRRDVVRMARKIERAIPGNPYR